MKLGRDDAMGALRAVDVALRGGEMIHVETLKYLPMLAARGFLCSRPMTRIDINPPCTLLVDWNTLEYSITKLGERELQAWQREQAAPATVKET